MAETTERKHIPGRWKPGQSGNPGGRPKGARHAALMALDAIGQDAAADVLGAVIAQAKAGDMRAAEILLRRVWPERKGRTGELDLPAVVRAADVPVAVAAVVAAVGTGDLSPEEGQAIAAMLDTQRRAIETADLAARVEALEEEQRLGR